MEDDKEENIEKIKIFSSDDEKLKMLGELLSNQSSRNIIKLLIDNEMYTNEIANKLDIRVNLVIHHLKKMEELGLLQVNHKKIVKKGNDHKYYKMIPNLFITPNESKEEIIEKGTLKNFFKDGIKFFIIGISAFSVFTFYPLRGSVDTLSNNSILESDRFVFPLLIIIIGLIIERILYYKKKKKRKYLFTLL